jgi:FlaA1/EpsC-like NDP-sugar epimerase
MEAALCVWVVAQSAAFIAARVDRGNWRYTSAHDAVRIVLADSAGSVLGGAVIFFLLGRWNFPRSAYILEWLLSCLLVLGGRLAVRVFTRRRGCRGGEEATGPGR